MNVSDVKCMLALCLLLLLLLLSMLVRLITSFLLATQHLPGQKSQLKANVTQTEDIILNIFIFYSKYFFNFFFIFNKYFTF